MKALGRHDMGFNQATERIKIPASGRILQLSEVELLLDDRLSGAS